MVITEAFGCPERRLPQILPVIFMFLSGNGTAGYNGNYTDLRNRSESALKLTPQASTLSVSSYFTPIIIQL